MLLNGACPQRPAQQTSQPVPPVQSALSRQWCGTHHLGPPPIAFATHVWMKLSLAGSASILWAASAHAICASTSHRFTKLKRAAPASLCSVAFALQVWSAAAVLLMSKAQTTKIGARGCIRSSRSRKPRWGQKRNLSRQQWIVSLVHFGALRFALALSAGPCCVVKLQIVV